MIKKLFSKFFVVEDYIKCGRNGVHIKEIKTFNVYFKPSYIIKRAKRLIEKGRKEFDQDDAMGVVHGGKIGKILGFNFIRNYTSYDNKDEYYEDGYLSRLHYSREDLKHNPDLSKRVETTISTKITVLGLLSFTIYNGSRGSKYLSFKTNSGEDYYLYLDSYRRNIEVSFRGPNGDFFNGGFDIGYDRGPILSIVRAIKDLIEFESTHGSIYPVDFIRIPQKIYYFIKLIKQDIEKSKMLQSKYGDVFDFTTAPVTKKRPNAKESKEEKQSSKDIGQFF